MFARTLQKSSTRITNLQLTKPFLNESIIRMASSTRPQRRFAPLGQPATEGAPQLQGIVFDMDGTLCKSFYLSQKARNGGRRREKERYAPKKKEHDTPLLHENNPSAHHQCHYSLEQKIHTILSHHPRRQRKTSIHPTFPSEPNTKNPHRRTPKLHVRRNALRPRHRQIHRHPRPHLRPPHRGRARRSPCENPSRRAPRHGIASAAARVGDADGVLGWQGREEGDLHAEFRVSCCLSFHRSLGSFFFYMFFCCH